MQSCWLWDCISVHNHVHSSLQYYNTNLQYILWPSDLRSFIPTVLHCIQHKPIVQGLHKYVPAAGFVLTFDLMYLVIDLCSWPTFVQKNIRSTRPTIIKRNPLGKCKRFQIIMTRCSSGLVDLIAIHYHANSPITIAGNFWLASSTGHFEHWQNGNALGTRLALITLKFP